MYLSFLITAHVPYVRRVGRAPTGEDELHRTIAFALVPLLNLLNDLRLAQDGPYIALACSPLLTEQLSDPVVQKHFVLWMEHWLAERAADLRREEAAGDDHTAYLSRFYLDWGRGILQHVEERYGRNLMLALRDLVTSEIVEPLSGASSQAFLPVLAYEETVRAQVEHAMLHTTRRLGRPQGLWSPLGGWRVGLETIAADVGLSYVVVDRSSMPPGENASVVWALPRRLAAICVDAEVSRHVWSRELGYRSDPLYRDSRVPGGYQAIGLNRAQAYDPYHAFRRAQEHARHFVRVLAARAAQMPMDYLCLVPLDLRHLGLYWFEGVTWFQEVLMLCILHPQLTLTTPARFLRQHKPQGAAKLRMGWLSLGQPFRLEGVASAEYWRAIHAAEQRLIGLVQRMPAASADEERLLNQAARELLLAQSCDWPLRLERSGGSAEVNSVWRTYLIRFAQLCDLLVKPDHSPADLGLLAQLEELDGPFPNLNYRIF
jgi:1,4-alpha-glucan branching enzyme